MYDADDDHLRNLEGVDRLRGHEVEDPGQGRGVGLAVRE